MEEILRDQGNKWMTAAKIASEVNSRGRYRRLSGTDISNSQITVRAKQYRQIFSMPLREVRSASSIEAGALGRSYADAAGRR
jgi:hypothetical protein